MMLANLVCSLIKQNRVVTTVAKAKAARQIAEKMVTLGKQGTLHARRNALARLHQKDAVGILFKEIAAAQSGRNGGYTRIIKLHQRQGDAAQMAILEWVESAPAAGVTTTSEATKQEAKTAQTKTNEVSSVPSKEQTADATKAQEKPEQKQDVSVEEKK
jgi:large subunit ribosomal protein L17